MKKLFVLIPLAAALTGCNNDIKAEPYTVPPELEAVLPPDPGEAGKATLEGIDSDGDGVRDDIQRYIAVTYQDRPIEKKIVTDSAILEADFLVASRTGDEEIVLEVTDKYFERMGCLFYRVGDRAQEQLNRLQAQMVNTEERTRAYIRGEGIIGGHTFTIKPRKEECKKEYAQIED